MRKNSGIFLFKIALLIYPKYNTNLDGMDFYMFMGVLVNIHYYAEGTEHCFLSHLALIELYCSLAFSFSQRIM